MYGNPIDRTFIMESATDVKSVINQFNECPLTKRHILASNIKKAFKEFGMKQPIVVEENNTILNFLKSDYVKTNENQSKYDNISEIDIDELKLQTYNNINDFLSSIEPVKESDMSYETVVNSVTFPDTELTKKIKKLCVRNDGDSIITNLSDMDIFKIKAKLMKSNPSNVKFVNDNDTNFAVIENQSYMLGKFNDNEYALISNDLKCKKIKIGDNEKEIKSIEDIKRNMG